VAVAGLLTLVVIFDTLEFWSFNYGIHYCLGNLRSCIRWSSGAVKGQEKDDDRLPKAKYRHYWRWNCMSRAGTVNGTSDVMQPETVNGSSNSLKSELNQEVSISTLSLAIHGPTVLTQIPFAGTHSIPTSSIISATWFKSTC
ncbi:hypothetical protein Tco_0849631, partial [Tanacetum coccineum]